MIAKTLVRREDPGEGCLPRLGGDGARKNLEGGIDLHTYRVVNPDFSRFLGEGTI